MRAVSADHIARERRRPPAGHARPPFSSSFLTVKHNHQGLYDTPMKKVLGLLQWMEGSAGKKRISSTRGSAIVPAFNLLPLKATAARR